MSVCILDKGGGGTCLCTSGTDKHPHMPQQNGQTVATAESHPLPPHAHRYTDGGPSKSFPTFLM